jgi:hypothetical protein
MMLVMTWARRRAIAPPPACGSDISIRKKTNGGNKGTDYKMEGSGNIHGGDRMTPCVSGIVVIAGHERGGCGSLVGELK